MLTGDLHDSDFPIELRPLRDEHVDSANLSYDIPLFTLVREHLPSWRNITRNLELLSWIEHGVTFPMLDTPTPFVQT